MKTTNEIEFGYIETPRRGNPPVKIDTILEQRMLAFVQARRMRRFTFFNR